jgi:hypothetical protein
VRKFYSKSFLHLPFRLGVILYFHSVLNHRSQKVGNDDISTHTTKDTKLSSCISFLRGQTKACTCASFLRMALCRTLWAIRTWNGLMSYRWFAYGWRLRELVGQKKVGFYSADWSNLDTRWNLRDVTYRATLSCLSEVSSKKQQCPTRPWSG